MNLSPSRWPLFASLLFVACTDPAAAGQTTTPLASHPAPAASTPPPSSGGAEPAQTERAASAESQDPGADGADSCTQPGSALNAETAARTRPIAVGDLVHDRLEASDIALQDGSVADDYAVDLVAGSPVTIVTRGGPSQTTPGTTLDMYTLLIGGCREVTHDDDSAANGGALNSRITYTPPADGRYVIRVTTFGAGLKEGTYELQIYGGDLPNQL
jgi:hypothetical protein